MSWVRGIDVIRLLEAFGPWAEDGEDRRHGMEVWTVSESQIGLKTGPRLARRWILAEFDAKRTAPSHNIKRIAVESLTCLCIG